MCLNILRQGFNVKYGLFYCAKLRIGLTRMMNDVDTTHLTFF